MFAQSSKHSDQAKQPAWPLTSALGVRMKNKERQTLDEILQSVSDSLYPDKMGKAKVKINSKDVCGDTPLHVLSRRGNNYGLELLLENGAEINAIGDMGETPLHVAISKENIKAIELLLNSGAKVNIKSEFNETAIEKAKKKGGQIATIVKTHKST